ncbi:jg17795 [Pararge aegeria aegeria]|uniref:Jg17795 protein n=1 Tax=Pararge aegeria aegeria TaxID=348720 RepID=A0A8S4QER0_9NEOP|nr:jg17795 [Pararge aegeria aegeria]
MKNSCKNEFVGLSLFKEEALSSTALVKIKQKFIENCRKSPSVINSNSAAVAVWIGVTILKTGSCSGNLHPKISDTRPGAFRNF